MTLYAPDLKQALDFIGVPERVNYDMYERKMIQTDTEEYTVIEFYEDASLPEELKGVDKIIIDQEKYDNADYFDKLF